MRQPRPVPAFLSISPRWRPTVSTPITPIGVTADGPVRPAAQLFYAQEKAELETLLRDEGAGIGPFTFCARQSW
jgi:hypothetical protein